MSLIEELGIGAVVSVIPALFYGIVYLIYCSE